MVEYVENDVEELTSEMFNEALNTILKKPGGKYDFIVKGGQSLMYALFNLFHSIWKSEKVPSSWHYSELVQLHKG